MQKKNENWWKYVKNYLWNLLKAENEKKNLSFYFVFPTKILTSLDHNPRYFDASSH